MHKICVIKTSTHSLQQAEALATGLIETQQAGCVQIIGVVSSIYRWKGVVEQADEYQLEIKTTRKTAPQLMQWLKQNHPYELPEIICSEHTTTSEYATWLQQVTTL